MTDGAADVQVQSTSHEFNTLTVIESLADGALRTGQRQANDAIDLVRQLGLTLSVTLDTPETKAEFLAALSEIRRQAEEQSTMPILHLETHGDQDGLALKSGEHLDWASLRDVLIDINRACGLNMLVVVAACSGAHLIKTATQLGEAPFWAVVGSDDVLKAGEIQDGFGAFYRTLLTTLNGTQAVEALNQTTGRAAPTFRFLSAEALFLRAYATYFLKYTMGRGKRERFEALVSDARKNPTVAQKGLSWVRAQVKALIGPEQEEEYFEAQWARFFFIAEHPDNAKRFALTYRMAIQYAKARG